MQTSRRVFLKSSLLAGANSVALMYGARCWARWQSDSIVHAQTDAVIQALLNGATAEVSDKIILNTPLIQENPALVPVSIETSMEGVEAISLLVDDPDSPLAASFEFPKRSITRVGTRIRLDQTSRVWAVVKAGSNFYITGNDVEITGLELEN